MNYKYKRVLVEKNDCKLCQFVKKGKREETPLNIFG